MSISFKSSINSLKERGILKICFLPKTQYDKFQVCEFHGDVTLSYQISTFLLNYKPFFTPHLLTELRSLSSSNQILSDFFTLFEIDVFIPDEEVQSYNTKARADVIEAMISELSQSTDADAQLLLKSIVGFLIGWGERDFNLKYPHIIEEGILKKPKASEKPKAIVSYVISKNQQQNHHQQSKSSSNNSFTNDIYKKQYSYSNQQSQQIQPKQSQQQQPQQLKQPQQLQQSQQLQKVKQQYQFSQEQTFIPLLTPSSIDTCKFEKPKEEPNMYDNFGAKKSSLLKKDKKEFTAYFDNGNTNNNKLTNNNCFYNNNFNSTNNNQTNIINILEPTKQSSIYSSKIDEEVFLLSPYIVEAALNAQQRSNIN